ncbi:MAG TPA: SDR family oxidoreductase [Flavobacteriales bacterium]|nr:SDR family oxidoreductase [Flavobacteriales bacterium]HMW95748.1 SDR family oxidoreductase [Flavobacteriales bacterium]HNK41532.1 SDR family oxidoreductase [Flavobacteriales bacterium]HNK85031.1 SDR family oxidoreductase [Flavobacteriales bacterium]
MDLSLIGNHALVCGASQGIGRAAALELARLGASVTLLARDGDKLRVVLAELDRTAGQGHATLEVDMSVTEQLRAAMEALLAKHGPVHILVNNSGGPTPGLAHESAVNAFAGAFRQHLLAFQTMVLALVPGMKDAGHGRIINVISTSVKQPLPNLGVSNTVRGAVAQWSKTLASELGPFGITVNNVLPGATRTERLATIIRNRVAKTGQSEEEVAHEMTREVPLRRFAEPWEIAAAIAFLAGPSAAYINGINLPVDGGRTGCL